MLKAVLLFNLLLSNAIAVAAHAAHDEEVSLWPAGSKVLTTGIEMIAAVKDIAPELAITHPTFLVHRPTGHSTRSAVIVFPGGGYKVLAIGKESTLGPEGADVCRWLTDAGVTCFLLKYRVPYSGCHRDPRTGKHVTPDVPLALQDAQRTIAMVRFYASKYGIEPDRIGVMGFSAGGNLAVLASTAFNQRSYDALDEIDRTSSRPDFAIPVYPGLMTMEHKSKTPRQIAARELNSDIVLSAQIPPTLLVHAKDDPVDPVRYSQVYAKALKQTGIEVKLNLYETGGHAFGVHKSGRDTDRWMDDAMAWLKEIKMR